jgi:hypothetical protein
LLARYRHLRQVGLRLNNRLVKTLPKSAFDEGGKKLGLLKNKTVYLDTEDEIAVLIDYCLYDVRRQGRNTVERFLAESPPPAGSDEMILLQAMCAAHYALFAVEAVERGVGVHARDLLRDEARFIVDVGFGTTAPVGIILAARYMAPEGIGMTTGAGLPVGMLSAAERAAFLRQVTATLQVTDFRNLSPGQASELTAAIIRACLEHGAAERIEYTEPRGSKVHECPDVAAKPPRRARPNERCPCGSGRKFKNCCGCRRRS